MIERFKRAMAALTGRSLENPNLSLTDPTNWPDEWLNTTDTGLKISHRSALRYAPVLQAVSLISGDAAKLPLYIYKRQPELSATAREIDRDHAAYPLCRYRPNDEIGAYKFWRRFYTHGLLWGNAYAYIERDRSGNPLALYNLLPDRTRAERVRLPGFDTPQLVYVTEVDDPNGSRLKVLFPFEVLHVEGVCTDNLAGADLVNLMRNGWALGLALEGFAAKFFRQGARVGGVLEIPNTFSRTAATNLQEGFTSKHTGPDNWFRVAILRDGAKFHSTTLSPQEGKLVESGEAVVRQVARAFNLPPSKLGLNDAVSYGSLSESNQAYLDSTLSPWLIATADECRHKLLTDVQRYNDTHFFAHDTSKLIALDGLKQAQTHAIYIRNQVLSPDEVRADINRNPRADGKGDEYFTPGGGNPTNQGGSNDGQLDNDGPQSERQLAIRRVVYNLTARGRHKANKPDAFIEWVDGELKHHRTEYVDLVGSGCAEFFEPIVKRLRAICDDTPAAKLPRVVDDYFCELEKGQ